MIDRELREQIKAPADFFRLAAEHGWHGCSERQVRLCEQFFYGRRGAAAADAAGVQGKHRASSASRALATPKVQRLLNEAITFFGEGEEESALDERVRNTVSELVDHGSEQSKLRAAEIWNRYYRDEHKATTGSMAEMAAGACRIDELFGGPPVWTLAAIVTASQAWHAGDGEFADWRPPADRLRLMQAVYPDIYAVAETYADKSYLEPGANGAQATRARVAQRVNGGGIGPPDTERGDADDSEAEREAGAQAQ